MDNKIRCPWGQSDPIYQSYHDHEWGRPLHDDRQLFEMLCLEGAQAGLSWITVLKKRENYRLAFDHFNPEIMAKYDDQKKDQLFNNPGIIRNRLKINAFINNAQCYLNLLQQFDTFDSYIWQFVGGQSKINHWSSINEIPVSTTESDAMSKDLKKRGFKFVGSTICYAYMQAVGMVNDHLTDCFCHSECQNK